MSSFPFKTYYFATISDHLGKHKNIFRELKTDQDRLKSDRHGGHGKAKECQRWIEVGHGVKKSRRFFVSKLPEDHIDLRGGTHSQASAPLYLVLPRIGMILVWKIRSSSTCLVFCQHGSVRQKLCPPNILCHCRIILPSFLPGLK